MVGAVSIDNPEIPGHHTAAAHSLASSPHQVLFSPEAFNYAAQKIWEPVHIVMHLESRTVGISFDGKLEDDGVSSNSRYLLLGTLPPLYPEWLGERSFGECHKVRFPYVAGEMANGIATTAMVVAMAKAEMLGFFGAGGLSPERVEQAVTEIKSQVGERQNWGVNLIHSPNEPEVEERVAEALLRNDVPIISASAYMKLTPAVIRCSATGLRVDKSGLIVRRRRVFAKVSRPEVAEQFMSPAPSELLRVLVARGQVTSLEAELAARIPVADDITVEADSGGHTDNRPLGALLPAMLLLRDDLVDRFKYRQVIRIGAAGGLGTPHAVASAFAMGAAYVLTGSINQTSLEAGLSEYGKNLLSEADIADVVMAPASDMFEFGVKLQVLRRGSMFAQRASFLYEIYRTCPSLEEIPRSARARLERDILRGTVEECWEETEKYWRARDPAQLAEAEQDPRQRMALLFRSYLGQSSRWAISGEPSRRTDYQIWCGPAIGAFNRWIRGSYLAMPENRSVVQIARNLLAGATALTRAHQLRSYGVAVPAEAFTFQPRQLL